MNLYSSWVYQYILNAEWFVWGIIIVVLGFNLLSPFFLWYSLTETKITYNPLKYVKKLMDQDESAGS